MRNTLLVIFVFFINILHAQDSISINDSKESFKNRNKNVINAIVLKAPNTEIEDIENLKGIYIENLCTQTFEKKLEKFLKLYLGKEITNNILDCIEKSILKIFQTYGYPFIIIAIPEQKISNGVITFIIYESTINNFEIKGNQHFKTSILQNYVSIKKGQTININNIVQDLYWINKNPFRQASTLFQSGEEQFTTDVDYIINDRRTFRIYAGSENTGFETTDKERVYIGFNWGNVWNLDHILTFQYTSSTDFNRFQSYTGSYVLPFLGKHLITVYGGYSWFNPSMAITDLKNEGKSYQASFRYTHPLDPFKQSFVQDISMGFDIKNTNTNLTYRQVPMLGNTTLITQFAFTYVVNYEKPKIRLPLQVDWFLSLGNIFPNQKNTDFGSLRFKAKNRYFYAHITYTPYFQLIHDIQLLLNLQAQFSTANLLSSEQIGLGGYNTIRGYEYREVNKDNGLITSIELVLPSLNILPKISKKNELKFLAFIDFGVGWDHTKTPEVQDPEYLIGIGPGLRLTFSQYLYARLDWAYKLHKTAFEPNANNSRWHFGITANY